MPAPPDTVIAARLHEHGRPLSVEAVPIAVSPPAGEVRIELEYGGVNPIDRYIAEGRVAAGSPLPRTLGGEAAGRDPSGQAVLVAGGGLGASRDGVWAGAAIVPIAAVHPLPDGVATREAATMGVAGLTAWNVVHDLAAVVPEDRVLVLGASGGVGSMIVSLVRAVGATVWGQTGSDAKTGHIVEQGADRAIVAEPGELTEAIAGLEPTVVFDPLGGEFVAPVVQALAAGGRIVTFGTSAGAEVTFNLQTVYRKGASVLGYGGLGLTTEQRRRGLQAALGALADGTLRVRIDDVLALSNVNAVFTRLAERRVEGKLLLALA